MSVLRTDRCRECGHEFSATSLFELDKAKAAHDAICQKTRSKQMGEVREMPPRGGAVTTGDPEKYQQQPGSLNAELHRLRDSISRITGSGEVGQHLLWLTDLLIRIEMRDPRVMLLREIAAAIEAETTSTDRESDTGYQIVTAELARCHDVDGGQLESATGCTNRANTDSSSALSSLGSPEGTGAPVRVEE